MTEKSFKLLNMACLDGISGFIVKKSEKMLLDRSIFKEKSHTGIIPIWHSQTSLFVNFSCFYQAFMLLRFFVIVDSDKEYCSRIAF